MKISPALSHVLRRHYDGDYSLAWGISFIKSYSSRREIIAVMKRRIKEVIERDMAGLKFRSRKAGMERLRTGMLELITDITKLPHADIDLLKRACPEEILEMAISKKITKINGQPIKMEA